jgi:transposase
VGKRRFCRDASVTGLKRAILFVRVDVFVEALDLSDLGFDGVQPLATGRPAYHPSTLLKLYI